MDKPVLERFISKYNLGGAAESVIFNSENGEVSTKFITDDKNAVGFLTVNKPILPDGEYPVYDTAQLRSLLSVLGEDIKITINKKGDTPTSWTMTDKDAQVTYVLAEKANIPNAPGAMKNVPDFEVVINFDEKFLNTFIKAKSALPDVETFAVVTEKGMAKIILGFSELNTNRVSLTPTSSEVKSEIEPIHFSARYFREMLSVNKEMKSGKLTISSKGLAHIEFTVDDFTVDYYLVKINV